MPKTKYMQKKRTKNKQNRKKENLTEYIFNVFEVNSAHMRCLKRVKKAEKLTKNEPSYVPSTSIVLSGKSLNL